MEKDAWKDFAYREALAATCTAVPGIDVKEGASGLLTVIYTFEVISKYELTQVMYRFVLKHGAGVQVSSVGDGAWLRLWVEMPEGFEPK